MDTQKGIDMSDTESAIYNLERMLAVLYFKYRGSNNTDAIKLADFLLKEMYPHG